MARKAKRFDYERSLFTTGIFDVAGVDEAGRGPLAGPVVAAAVIFPRDWIEKGMPKKLKGVNDSKQLTALQREELYFLITAETGVRFAVGKVEVEMIDQINILQATHRAMNAALAQLIPPPQHVLVDGLPVPSMKLPQTAVVDGDALSYSIAAASIIAKVTRDRLMLNYHLQYPAYGFAEHKGYGTPQHLAALTQFGPCPIHRRTFAPIRLAQTEFFPEME